MELLASFAAALGVAAIVGSITEAVTAETKLEKYVRLIVAFCILIVIFSFIFRVDYKDFKIDIGSDEFKLPNAENIAREGALSLSRTELAKKIEEALKNETGMVFTAKEVHMAYEGESIILEKLVFSELHGYGGTELSEIIYKMFGIKIEVTEDGDE